MVVTPPTGSDRSVRVVAATDGTLVAVAEGAGITLCELPQRTRIAEINIDPDASAFDVGWLGARLLVVSRFEAHTTVHLLDPQGPRTLSEIELEAPMRLFATVGPYALVAGSAGVAILSASDTHVTPYQFPARVAPTAACGSASRFMVAVPGAIEEWDPQSRLPKRRLRLPRPANITALGASDRVVWMTTQQEPSRLDVVPLVNRGQPKAHDIGEPIAFATGHPRSELVLCLGAETGKLYAVDLDGRARHRVVSADGLARIDGAALVLSGRQPAVAIAESGGALVLASLEQREVEADRPSTPAIALPWSDGGSKRSSLVEDNADAQPELPTESVASMGTRANIAAPWGARGSADLGSLGALGFVADRGAATVAGESSWASRSTLVEMSAAPAVVPAHSAVIPAAPPATAPAPPSTTKASLKSGSDLSKRFSAWRDRLKETAPGHAVTGGSSVEPVPTFAAVQPGTEPIALARGDDWRDELVTWARGDRAAPLPSLPNLATLAHRFELGDDLLPALAACYGAHLCGERGVAPADLARLAGWPEALGRGELARTAIATFDDSRVRLAEPVQRALDELAPRWGDIVGDATPSSLLGPCAIVAPGEPLADIARRVLSAIGGGILAASRQPDVDALFLEARARGLVPLLHVDTLPKLRLEPCIVVADTAEILEYFQIPRL